MPPDPGAITKIASKGASAAKASVPAGAAGATAATWASAAPDIALKATEAGTKAATADAPAAKDGAPAPMPTTRTDAMVSLVTNAVDQVGAAEGVLPTIGAAMGVMTAAEQAVSSVLGAIPFPPFPALRITDLAVGLPHAHMHPPNLIPPAPPVPLPSIGPVIPIPFFSGAMKTLINGLPAARCGDLGLGVWCGGYFPMYEVFLGSATVWTEGARAARMGCDITKHCIFTTPRPSDPPVGPMIGTTITGSFNVMIGGVPLPSFTAMAMGAAFKAGFRGLGAAASKVRGRFSRWSNLRAPRGMGGVEATRSSWMGKVHSMDDLVARRGVPGRQGVVLADNVADHRQLYGGMWELSQKNGIEYALTFENGAYVLRSGAADTVAVPRGVTPLAHTHPPDELGRVQPMPSRADVNTLNDLWDRNPNGPRPQSDIIWGPGADDVTPFGATGLDPIPDPTRGGLKPNRRWH